MINRRKVSKGLKLREGGSVQDGRKAREIVGTTSPSRKRLIRLGWLKEGVHINAIGADAKGKQELNPAILKEARIVVDSWEQASHSGEINVALSKKQLSKKDIFADIGQVVCGTKKARIKRQQITVFDSTGLASQDMALARVIYKKAVRLKKGKYASFI